VWILAAIQLCALKKKSLVQSSPVIVYNCPTRAHLRKYLEEAATLLSTDAKEMTLEDNEFRIEEVIACISYKQYFYSRAMH